MGGSLGAATINTAMTKLIAAHHKDENIRFLPTFYKFHFLPVGVHTPLVILFSFDTLLKTKTPRA